MTANESQTTALRMWGSHIRNIRNSLKRSIEGVLKVIEVIPARMNSRILEFHRAASIPYYAEHYAYFTPKLSGEIEDIMRGPMENFAALERMSIVNPARRALKRKTAESIVVAYDAMGDRIALQIAAIMSA